VKEFMSLYEGKEPVLLKSRYRDYVQWQNSQKQREVVKHQEEYWVNRFKEGVPLLLLPTDYERPLPRSFAGGSLDFIINKEETQKLKNLAAGQGVTLYMAMLAIVNIFLWKLSGNDAVVLGTPMAGRYHPDLENIIGMFVNTLVLQNYPSAKKTCSEFLQDVKQRTLEAFENRDYPFADLVERLEAKKRNPGYNPLFDVMFNMQNPDIPAIVIPGLKVLPYKYENQTSKFDMTLTAVETNETLLFNIEYCTRLFKKETIERFTRYFRNIISGIPPDGKKKLSDIEIIPGEEKKQILVDFNRTGAAYPKDKLIHELFEEQVEGTPDHAAVISRRWKSDSDLYVTYGELKRKCHQLVRRLKDKGLRPLSIVGIIGDRSPEMTAGILAILKCGGTYLPIDADYPDKRREYMLKDCAVDILLLQSQHPSRDDFNQPIIHLEWEPGAGVEAMGGGDHWRTIINAASPAYIMYTSGTSGQPKGVVVTHRNVVRLVKNTNYVPLTGNTRILQTGAQVFDASTFEIWGSLLNGGQLVLTTKEIILDAHQLANAVKEMKVNTLWLTSPLFNQLLHQNIEIFSTLSYLLVGGDILSPAHINRLRGEFPKLKIINGYGPTENTTFSTTYLIEKEFKQDIPIGSPINNSTAYIVDKNNHLQPIGIWGELYVGGDGVSLGYINNPELTTEKFIYRSYRSYKTYISKKIYRTGDISRWLPDGNIQFAGRSDQQVKVRGFRIEPGEIEKHLLKANDIKEAVVIAVPGENKDKNLCAYIVSNREILAAELRNYLSGQLPDYMIPNYFVRLEKIPLTPNGKIDRKALPGPEPAKSREKYTPPRNRLEEKLQDIWSNILNIEKNSIGIDTGFFELGGHSLKASILAANIHKELNIKISPTVIFKTPRIRGLAKYISGLKQDQFPTIKPVEKRDFYELSVNQERLWVINRLEPESPAYHIPGRIVLNHKVDEKMVKKALYKIIERHESFRTGFKPVNHEPVQIVYQEVKIPFKIIDISSRQGMEQEQEKERIYAEMAAKPFQLTDAPLFRSVLVKLDREKYELMFNIHHIIADGWSMEILKNEFSLLYQGYRTGKQVEIQPGKLQFRYRDFAGWHNKRLKDPVIKENSHQYWKEKLEPGIPLLELPADSGGNRENSSGAAYRCKISSDIKEKLKKLAGKHDTSLFTVMFSAFLIFLWRLSGREEVACSIISAGRQHISLHDIIGYFINPVIFKTVVKPGQIFKDFLPGVSLDVRETFQHQDYPLEWVFEDLKMKYPAIPVVFNMLNMEEAAAVNLEDFTSHHIEKIQDVKFDLELFIIEHKNSIEMRWNYKKVMFKPASVEYLAGEYLELLTEISACPGNKIKSYHVFCLKALEIKGNQVHPQNDFLRFEEEEICQSLKERFEAQVTKYPHHTAVKTGNQILTYRELNERSNPIAWSLYKICGRQKQGVALLCEHDAEMIVGIWAILKSGNFYIPLDPTYPAKRTIYMLKDSNAKILISDGKNKEPAQQLIKESKKEIKLVEVNSPGKNLPKENLNIKIKPQDLAYILYTSGSTG
ncbi:MAG: amino acid adenylation domain-containing protein, partial [Candidatus Aminicenantes bacterium]